MSAFLLPRLWRVVRPLERGSWENNIVGIAGALAKHKASFARGRWIPDVFEAGRAFLSLQSIRWRRPLAAHGSAGLLVAVGGDDGKDILFHLGYGAGRAGVGDASLTFGPGRNVSDVGHEITSSYLFVKLRES
jgi:hypothetical protein